MALYSAKKVGVTEKESRYVILQDGPASFHITVQRGDIAIYDYLYNPRSMEEIDSLIESLEKQII